MTQSSIYNDQGNKMANAAVWTDEKGSRRLISYNTLVATLDNSGTLALVAPEFCYSQTTRRQLRAFLSEYKPDLATMPFDLLWANYALPYQAHVYCGLFYPDTNRRFVNTVIIKTMDGNMCSLEYNDETLAFIKGRKLTANTPANKAQADRIEAFKACYGALYGVI